MNRSVLIGLVASSGLLILVLAFSSGSTTPESRRKSKGNVPSRFEHDFGIVRTNEVVEHTFVIPGSQQAVRPVLVTASCTCVKAFVETKLHQPNESIFARVQLKANALGSDMKQSLTVKFENQSLPDCVLGVRAQVRPELYVSVDRLKIELDVGDNPNSRQFIVRNYSTVLWPTVIIKSDVEWLAATCSEIQSLERKPIDGVQSCSCELNLKLEKTQPGSHSGRLTIIDPFEKRSIELPIELNLRPEIMLFPGSWYVFGGTTPELESKLVFRSDKKVELSQMKVVTSTAIRPLVEVSLEASNRSSGEFVLRGRCKKRPETETQGEIEVLFMDAPHRSPVKLPVLIAR